VEQIGRYRILGELGRGATGVVYRAQDPAIGRTIAIKTIRLSDFTDASERDRLRERLFREAQSAGILSHPNIVTIYDIAEENGLAYIFMEFVDGPPLEKVLDGEEPIAGSVALSILRQTAVGLDYAHKKGIVHRDIKPANILIHEGTHAKITDFGVAKILSQQMTQHGVMMGTPNYMSPEQVQGHAVEGRTDQFSLAVIAYEMLTGEKPFVADQLPSLLYRIVREDPVAPHRLNPSLGFQVEAVLKKGLSKNATDRYDTSVEFVEALAAACAANPGWHPLPRSSAQTLPTMGGPFTDRKPVEHPVAPAREAPPARAPERSTPPFLSQTHGAEAPNPLLRSLVWMLVGIGLVGLVLFGAQKFLFNRNTEPPAGTQTEAQSQQPASQTPDLSASKPSPIGQPKVPEEAVKQTSPPETPPETTSPENSDPVKSKPSAPQETRPAQEPSIPAPVVASKAGPQQSVQFLTDPPGAQVTVDGNTSQACKTPCIMPLSPGRHALSAELASYRPYPRVFNVPQDSDIFLQLSKASGTLSVTSNPAGAAIEIDGQMQSKRTPAVFNFAPGNYHVKVSRSGAFLDFDVQIHDGEFVNKRVDF
jgi:serine/threonine protein kinase